MSFNRNNENFIRFEFYVKLKGLVGAEKESRYAAQIRPEARRRIRLYYEAVSHDIPKKIELYQELIEIFGAVEKRWLLYSIYLDPHVEAISPKIGGSIVKYLDLGNDPLRTFFEQKISRHDNSLIKGYLKQYFTATLDLVPGEWEVEDGRTNNNPVTNRMITWLINTIIKEPLPEELEQFIFNYTKLWNIYFVRTYNINKALILIHKFFDQYRNLDPRQLKIDLNALLPPLNSFISDLLPEVFNSPLTDVRQPSEILKDGSYRNQASTKNYLNKIVELQDRLQADAVFFQDLQDLDWPVLFNKACMTPLPARLAYFGEVAKRMNDGRPPNFTAIKKFLDEIAEVEIDLQTLEKIVTDNYLFFV